MTSLKGLFSPFLIPQTPTPKFFPPNKEFYSVSNIWRRGKTVQKRIWFIVWVSFKVLVVLRESFSWEINNNWKRINKPDLAKKKLCVNRRVKIVVISLYCFSVCFPLNNPVIVYRVTARVPQPLEWWMKMAGKDLSHWHRPESVW